MSPGRLDSAVVRRHLLSIDDAVRNLRRHQGRAADLLASNRDELWSVERGLQLCAQNVLDIATHIAASAGREVADYGSAIQPKLSPRGSATSGRCSGPVRSL